MNILDLKTILEVLDQVGITEAVIEPGKKPNTTLIRAASKDTNIVVFDEIEGELTPTPIGIQSVKGFLSRLSLFDVEKAAMSMENHRSDEYVSSSQIKEGRRKATFRCAPPRTLNVPHEIPLSEDSEFIELLPDYVDYLSGAISSMSYTGDKRERTISMRVEDNDLHINIFDGEDDCFDDIMSDVGIDELPSGSWDVAPFQRVMKQSMQHDEDKVARVTITDYRVALFQVGVINVMVSPMV